MVFSYKVIFYKFIILVWTKTTLLRTLRSISLSFYTTTNITISTVLFSTSYIEFLTNTPIEFSIFMLKIRLITFTSIFNIFTFSSKFNMFSTTWILSISIITFGYLKNALFCITFSIAILFFSLIKYSKTTLLFCDIFSSLTIKIFRRSSHKFSYATSIT